MFYTYGIHKKIWNKYKRLVIEKGYNNLDLIKEYELNDKQMWFLFTKLLQNKYNHLYLRKSMEAEDIKKGQYVYNEEYGNGEIVQVLENDLMLVKFDSRELKTMCSQKGYTLHDDKKRKVTKR